jgi:23S rRNA (uridine2552-2'-O)-methyltransferase
VASKKNSPSSKKGKPAKAAKTGRRPDGFISKGNARYDRHDTYYRQAKKEGFAARSIYKLEEIDDELHLFKANDRVLDLGTAPGSWMQYVDQRAKSAVGIDLLPVKVAFSSKVTVLQGDAFETKLEDMGPFDVVLSDMAPNTTGIRSVDQARSLALCERALEVAERSLRKGGRFCVKILEGGEIKHYIEHCKKLFETVKVKRPKSTREGSTETYIIGLNRLAGPAAPAAPST